MTESGVKKMLNAKDISLRRILNICELLNVRPGQLFSMSESSQIPSIPLTQKQEDALIHDRKLLAVDWLIVVEKQKTRTLDSILRISKAQLDSYLRHLVNLKLLSQRRKEFIAPFQGKFKWPDESKLAILLNRDWSYLQLNRALSQKPERDAYHRLLSLRLSKRTYKTLKLKLSEAFDEVLRASEREEMSLSGQELMTITSVATASRGGFFDP